MVVSVMFANKNRVHAFHVLMPDGTEFVLKKLKQTPEWRRLHQKVESHLLQDLFQMVRYHSLGRKSKKIWQKIENV